MEIDLSFEDPPKDAAQLSLSFHVNIDGFEGPIDLLLHLARKQKVDLAQISVLQLANQYLEFIAAMKNQDLQLAADYLVMAAWLAYLKSRLLLPDLEGEEEEISAQDMEAALAFRLKQLQSMQKSGRALMDQPLLGRDVFARSEDIADDRLQIEHNIIYEVNLFDLLRAYGSITRQNQGQAFKIPPTALFSVEKCVERLKRLLGLQVVPTWQKLQVFLPKNMVSAVARRSACASTFVASLDLANKGILQINQEESFGPIYLRSATKLPANTP